MTTANKLGGSTCINKNMFTKVVEVYDPALSYQLMHVMYHCVSQLSGCVVLNHVTERLGYVC